MKTVAITPIADRPPAGWFLLDIMRKSPGGDEWVALMIDVDPKLMRQYRLPSRECWVRVPGRHRGYDSAASAFDDATATRH